MRQADIEPEIDKLYQLPLSEFTPARNALAKEAGPAGADIRSLQKPPVAAWAVNQVYWQRQPEYDALVEAATALRAAHKAVLAGRRADLRAVSKQHEEALEDALKAALAVLKDAGHPVTDATRHTIATTLRGLPAGEPPGRLARVLQPGGFEILAGIPVRAAPPARAAAREPRAAINRTEPEAAKPSAAEAKALARARDAVASAARDVKVAEHAARREEFEAARAARDAEKAIRALDAARAELEAAQRAADEAERKEDAANRKRQSAERRARDTDAALAAAKMRLADAESTLKALTAPGKR
jgi:flagellin-like hook-associated protein FlgL